MTNDLVIFGAWYFGDVIEELASESGWRVAGRVDPQPPAQVATLSRFPVDAACFVAIGDNAIRRYVTERLEARGRRLISLVHGTAIISPSAEISAGCYVGEHAAIRTQSRLGRGVVVNAGAVVSHHCRVDDFALLGPNAAMASRSTLGAGSLLGVGACVRPGCTVGAHSTVGPGAAVIRDIADQTTAIGNPAKTRGTANGTRRDRHSDWTTNTLW